MWFPCSSSAMRTKPNIVYINADDLGWADLGVYGSAFHETPHLDRLAERGTRLAVTTRSTVSGLSATRFWVSCRSFFRSNSAASAGFVSPRKFCHLPSSGR